MTQRPPAFWWRKPSPLELGLWPLARLWGLGAEWRINRPPRFAPSVPVVCVGNFVVGGAGKTPTVIALAALARDQGLRPGILARGYGGRLAGPVLVDPATHTAREVGDEALLLAAAAPTVVSADRAKGAARLIGEAVDLILLDDGFQDPALRKDLALLVADGAVGVGNGYTLPLGPLRAPLKAQIARTDALLLIGDDREGDGVVRAAARAGRPVFHAGLVPERPPDWGTQKVLAFAGIGRPEKFFASLAAAGAVLAATRTFGDHHVFTESNARELIAAAERDGCRLVTTAKDAVRLGGFGGPRGELREKTTVFRVTLAFDRPAAIWGLIEAAVRKARLRR